MISRTLLCVLAIAGLSGSAQGGFIEVCKDSIPLGSLSGSYTFSITGKSGTISTPVGGCTLPFELFDGLATITELSAGGTSLYMVDTFPAERLISFDLTLGTATVLIVPGDISTQTVLTFTNAPQAVPEPRTTWLFAVGLTLWAVRWKVMRIHA